MSYLLYLSLLFLGLLQACTVAEESAPTANAESGFVPLSAPEPEPSSAADRMHQVADDRTAGRIKPRAYLHRDSATGTEYQMNSGWRILPRQAASAGSGALAKTAGPLIQTWTDWSGRVEVRIYECVTPVAAQHQSLGCQVEPGFMLTGGGAYADYGNGPGALLWESRPLDANLVTWVASSKDHLRTCHHYLHVYSIGMRLKDSTGAYIPVPTLMPLFGLRVQFSSPPVPYPAHVDYEGSGMLHIGGGARTNWVREGSLLTQLMIDYGGISSQLSVSAREHGASELTTVNTYSIMAREHKEQRVKIPKFGTLQFIRSHEWGPMVLTGVAKQYRDVVPGSVLVSMGAESVWDTGLGRYFFGIKPTGTFQGQMGIFTKDHKYPCSGFIKLEMIQVQKGDT